MNLADAIAARIEGLMQVERIPSSDVYRYNFEVLRGNGLPQERQRGRVPLLHKAQ